MSIILLSGIPAAGKSTLGKYLGENHGFRYFDMEHPESWPKPSLHQVWDTSRREFVALLNQSSQPVVLDWGFPPAFLSWVLELKKCGVRLVWLQGNIEIARRHFRERNQRQGNPSEIGMEAFEAQARTIRAAGLPGKHGFRIVQAFDEEGSHRVLKDPEGLIKAVLAE